MEFMLKLKDIANDCSFTNSNEVVKFLFLTHNQNSRVKDVLLHKMKATSTLTECLAIAKTGVVAGDRNSIVVLVTKVVKDRVSVGIVVTITHP